MLKVPEKLPEWFVLASSKAMLTAKEVNEIFQLSKDGIYNEMSAGRFPRGVLRSRAQPSMCLYSRKIPMRWSKLL